MYAMFCELDFLLRVFDPGRLLVVRVGELKRINHQVKGVRPRPLTGGKGGELKRINHQVKGVRPRPLTCGKGGELKQMRVVKWRTTVKLGTLLFIHEI